MGKMIENRTAQLLLLQIQFNQWYATLIGHIKTIDIQLDWV